MSIKGLLNAKLRADHGTADRGQLGMNTIIAGFALVVIGAALVYAADIFDSSIGTPTNTALSESQQSMFQGFSSLADLVEPILIVAGIIVIIGLVRRVMQ